MPFYLSVLQDELLEYRTLLNTKKWYSEREIFDRYLKTKTAVLQSLIFSFFPSGETTFQLPFHSTEVVFDEFRADLILYNARTRRLCLVEFESAESNSVFVRSGRTRTHKFSTRLVAGLTQLIDWDSRISRIDQVHDNWCRFTGGENIRPSKIVYMLVIGRNGYIENSNTLQSDLDFRLNSLADRIRLGTGNLIIATYDEILSMALPLLPTTNLTP